jgi:hypothetical protein
VSMAIISNAWGAWSSSRMLSYTVELLQKLLFRLCVQTSR